jgi:glutamate/tyrosine decarboxylase-like PLP-dependent enzyme
MVKELVTQCKPDEIALKSFFLGPQSENAIWMQSSINELLVRWFEWRQGRFVEDGRAISAKDQVTSEFKASRNFMSEVIAELTTRFEAEIPKYSPRYAGHMFSEIAIPALMGHLIALLHNPNLMSGESARVGFHVENEAIDALIKMVGYESGRATGHFTSGGTIANFEAVTRARARIALWMAMGCAVAELNGKNPAPCVDAVMGWNRYEALLDTLKVQDSQWQSRLDSWNFELVGFHKFALRILDRFGISVEHPVLLVPAHRHYSWTKAAALFGFGDETMKLVHLDEHGRMDVNHLRQRISVAFESQHPLMMIVSVAGTNELGVMDPVDEVNAVCAESGAVWHHLDAAYGGFYAVLRDLDGEPSREIPSAAFKRAICHFHGADSITMDPHNLGYVPYAAGVFMVRDSRDYDLRAISAPYIQYEIQDRCPVTLEGSRPATSAAAVWMVSKTMPLNAQGFGRILLRNFRARFELEDALKSMAVPVRIVRTSDSNVLCFAVAAEGEALSVVNQRTNTIYHALAHPEARFFVSKTTISWQHAAALCERFAGSWGAQCDTGVIVLIRTCLMNPFFTSTETTVHYARELAHEIETLAMAQ